MKVFDYLGTCVREFYIERIAFYPDMFTLRLEPLWCVSTVYHQIFGVGSEGTQVNKINLR
jgi:hypothetical protein